MHNKIFILVRYYISQAGGEGMVSNIATLLEAKVETSTKNKTVIEEKVIAVQKNNGNYYLFEMLNHHLEKSWHLVGSVTKEGLLLAQYYSENKIYRNSERFYNEIGIERKGAYLKIGDSEMIVYPKQTASKCLEPFLEASRKLKLRLRKLNNN